MTPLAIDAPLASLLAIAGMTQEALAHACQPPQSKQAVTVAASRGDRIKLSTLAAYARAAGHVLRVQVWRWTCGCIGGLGPQPTALALACSECGQPLRLFADGHADDVPVTVAGARLTFAVVKLEMKLAVEPAEGSER